MRCDCRKMIRPASSDQVDLFHDFGKVALAREKLDAALQGVDLGLCTIECSREQFPRQVGVAGAIMDFGKQTVASGIGRRERDLPLCLPADLCRVSGTGKPRDDSLKAGFGVEGIDRQRQIRCPLCEKITDSGTEYEQYAERGRAYEKQLT